MTRSAEPATPASNSGAAMSADGPPGASRPPQTRKAQHEGLPVLVTVYVFWALLPIYWRELGHVPPFEILCHRSLWGLLFVLAALFLTKGFGKVTAVFHERRTLLFMVGCSIAHICGWGLFLWAIGNGLLLESSLGSYILPMLSLVAGFLFFKERPRRMQWIAIGIAATGVLGMIFWYGSLPLVALATALISVTFTICRKNAPIEATPGLLLEMLLSAPFLWGYLFYLHATGQGTLGTQTLVKDLWLMGAGIVTVIPQLGFAYGISRVSLTTLSLLQYLPPAGSFLVAIFMFNEPFGPDRVFGFACIWTGLALFTFEGYRYHRAHLQIGGS